MSTTLKIFPSITVVIPTFNRASFLKEALTSVAGQRSKPSEVIVIDDGSKDNTAEIVKQFPSVQYFYQDNKGVAAARNAGIKKAQGEWIAFLDSDDLWLPDKLGGQRAFIQQNPETRVVQTEELWIRNGRRVNPAKRHQKKSGSIFENCIPLCIVSPSTVMIHRGVFEKVGLFDEAMLFCEDYDLWLRIALHYPIDLIPEPLTSKRNGHEGQLSAIWGQDQWRIKALLKILKDPSLSPKQKELVSSDIRRRAAILAKGFAKHGKSEEADYFQGLTATSQ